MSIWGSLGNAAMSYLGSGGGGTTSQKLIPALIQAGAMTAGSIAQGREKGRETQNAQTMAQDTQRQRATEANNADVLDRAKLDLSQRQFKQSSQTDAFRKALASSLIKNLSDVHLNMPKDVPVFNFEGGLRPSALGPEGKKAADVLNQQAMMQLLNGEQFDKLPGAEHFNPSEMQHGGAMDSILGGIGMAGGALNQMQAANQNAEQNSLIKKLLAAQAGKAPIDVTATQPGTFINPDGTFGQPDFRTPGIFGG